MVMQSSRTTLVSWSRNGANTPAVEQPLKRECGKIFGIGTPAKIGMDFCPDNRMILLTGADRTVDYKGRRRNLD